MALKGLQKAKLVLGIGAAAMLVLSLVISVSIIHAAGSPPAPHLPKLNRVFAQHYHGQVGGIHSNQADNLPHGSGPVMHATTTYAIFWEPSHLQSGATTTVSSGYNTLVNRFMSDVGGTNFYKILSQYFDTNTPTGHIPNLSVFGGAYVDTAAYPAANADCTTEGSTTPVNCIGDAQQQAEITHAMSVMGWTGGPNKLFALFTSQGEDDCSVIAGGCFTTVYCGFHYFYGGSNTPYAMMPYNGTGLGCDTGTTPSPNANPDADHEISTLAHEMFEAASDPQPNANWTGPLGEIGDACAYNYGTLGLDSGQANEYLNGHYYLTQMMWNNRVAGCSQTA